MHFLGGSSEVMKYVGGILPDFVSQLSRDILNSRQPADAIRTHLQGLVVYLAQKRDAARSEWLRRKAELGAIKVSYSGHMNGQRIWVDDYVPAVTFDKDGWITGWGGGNKAPKYDGAGVEQYQHARALEDAYKLRLDAITQVLSILDNPAALQAEANKTRSSYADFWTVTEDLLNPVTLSPIVTINAITQKSEISTPLSPETTKTVTTVTTPEGTTAPVITYNPQLGLQSSGSLSRLYLPPVFFTTTADHTAPPPAPAAAKSNTVLYVALAAVAAWYASK